MNRCLRNKIDQEEIKFLIEKLATKYLLILDGIEKITWNNIVGNTGFSKNKIKTLLISKLTAR